MKKPTLIIIRGVSGSGKSTVADELRKYFGKDVAVIHTSIFYHEIVKGDKPEIVMENTYRILDNYLKNKYSVILEGTLSFKDKNNRYYFERFIRLAKKYKIPVKQFFFEADFSVLVKREKKRKKISLKRLKEMYNLAIKSKQTNEIIIDTSHKSVNQVVKEIIKW